MNMNAEDPGHGLPLGYKCKVYVWVIELSSKVFVIIIIAAELSKHLAHSYQSESAIELCISCPMHLLFIV